MEYNIALREYNKEVVLSMIAATKNLLEVIEKTMIINNKLHNRIEDMECNQEEMQEVIDQLTAEKTENNK